MDFMPCIHRMCCILSSLVVLCVIVIHRLSAFLCERTTRALSVWLATRALSVWLSPMRAVHCTRDVHEGVLVLTCTYVCMRWLTAAALWLAEDTMQHTLLSLFVGGGGRASGWLGMAD